MIVGAGLNLLEFGRFEIADVAGGVNCQGWMCAGELSGVSDFDLILGAIAFALDTNGFGVMEQAVQKCGSQDRVVVEDAGPVFVDAVGGHERGALFVAVADDLEQAVGAELVDR